MVISVFKKEKEKTKRDYSEQYNTFKKVKFASASLQRRSSLQALVWEATISVPPRKHYEVVSVAEYQTFIP